jgi:hypothetical protein
MVQPLCTHGASGKSVALSISLISLLITGLDVSATAQLAYARAFSMTPLRGVQKYLRGAGWLVLLLAFTVAALALRGVAAGRPFWLTLVIAPALLAGSSRSSSLPPACCWTCRSSGVTWCPARSCAPSPPSSCTP